MLADYTTRTIDNILFIFNFRLMSVGLGVSDRFGQDDYSLKGNSFLRFLDP